MVRVLKMSNFVTESDSTDFHITTIAHHVKVSHNEISLPHKHNFYVTVFFTQGTGVHEIDFTSYQVLPGSLFFLNPGQMHYWQLSDDADGYVILHTEQFYNLHYTKNRVNDFPFFASLQNPPFMYCDSETLPLLTGLFTNALQEKYNSGLLQHQKLCSLLDLIYIECAEYYAKYSRMQLTRAHYPEKFTQFELLVEENFRTVKLPSLYAKMLNISAKHLNRITQLAAEKTTSAIITDRIMLEAKREIIVHKQNLAQIAQNLGYEDYAYFSRVFKNKTGQTPSQFLADYI